MLVWIKESCVTVGVLASFLLVLSAADLFSSEATNFEAAEDSVHLMQLPFASGLLNPCSSEGFANRPVYVAPEGHRANFAVEFFRFISHYAKNYKEDAHQVLRNHTIHGCESLQVTNLPDTPTLEELQAMDSAAALNRIYSSLLLHSAYAYLIHYQFTSSSVQCAETLDEEESLALESLQLARKQKSLACYVRVGSAVLGYNQLEVPAAWKATHLTLCSRRALRDCQVINSIVAFLDVLKGYSDALS